MESNSTSGGRSSCEQSKVGHQKTWHEPIFINVKCKEYHRFGLQLFKKSTALAEYDHLGVKLHYFPLVHQ